MQTPVHIYQLSRLVHASPTDWESTLSDIENGKLYAFGYYQPLREGVLSYCRSRGKRSNEILQQIETRARSIHAPRGADPVRDNKVAFDLFVAQFYPRISKFQQSFPSERAGCTFTEVQLLGNAHFVATDTEGRDRYVYLLASKWDKDDIKAYLELLAVVIKGRFGATPESIWCMDLKSGKDFNWRSSQRIRSKCEKTAKLYSRFVRAMSSE